MDQTVAPKLSGRCLLALLLSTILPLLDSSVANVLIPVITHALGAGSDLAQVGVWGYLVAATVGIIASAPVVQRRGAHWVWVASITIFAVSSLGVAASWWISLFLVSRVVQGFAAGFIMPAVQQLLVELVGRKNMRHALATVGLPAVVAPALGPLLGGVLAHPGVWRLVFLVNIPLVAASLVLGHGHLHPAGAELARTDVPDAPSARRQILALRLYRDWRFALAMVVTALIGAMFFGTLLSTSLRIQVLGHAPAWVAGVVLGIQGVGAWVARSVVKGPGRTVPLFWLMAAGLPLVVVGNVLLDDATRWASVLMILGALLRGLGFGTCTLLALSAVYEVTGAADVSYGTANSRLMLQLGGAAGAAVAGAWVVAAPEAVSLGVGLAAAMAVVGCVVLALEQRRVPVKVG